MTSSPPAASRGPPASIEDQSGPTAGPYHYDPKTGAIHTSPPEGGSASIAQALPNARRHANGRLLAASDLLANGSKDDLKNLRLLRQGIADAFRVPEEMPADVEDALKLLRAMDAAISARLRLAGVLE